MIPRLKPFLGKEEIFGIFANSKCSVEEFEKAFANEFHIKHAIAFPYGRSALWAFFKAVDIANKEIVQPAYTCSVVAHATVLSGNCPMFVDSNLTDYTMNLDQFAESITPETRAVIPTHLFGYPMDIDTVNQIVHQSEKKFGHKIWIIQDCAHSFDARWKGTPVTAAGDGAIFGLGISKQITSIFGGMFTTSSDTLASKVRSYRDEHFKDTTWIKSVLRYIYLAATYPTFHPPLYGLVYWLQEKTPFLNRLTKAYHLDEKIHFPPDYMDHMTGIEAFVGLEQLKKYPAIRSKRIEIAKKYLGLIHPINSLCLPPYISGATYSHFIIRTELRDQLLAFFASRGIELGQLIEYSMPHHSAYKKYTGGKQFPNALRCSRSLINLPIYPDLSTLHVEKIASTLNSYENS